MLESTWLLVTRTTHSFAGNVGTSLAMKPVPLPTSSLLQWYGVRNRQNTQWAVDYIGLFTGDKETVGALQIKHCVHATSRISTHTDLFDKILRLYAIQQNSGGARTSLWMSQSIVKCTHLCRPASNNRTLPQSSHMTINTIVQLFRPHGLCHSHYVKYNIVEPKGNTHRTHHHHH